MVAQAYFSYSYRPDARQAPGPEALAEESQRSELLPHDPGTQAAAVPQQQPTLDPTVDAALWDVAIAMVAAEMNADPVQPRGRRGPASSERVECHAELLCGFTQRFSAELLWAASAIFKMLADPSRRASTPRDGHPLDSSHKAFTEDTFGYFRTLFYSALNIPKIRYNSLKSYPQQTPFEQRPQHSDERFEANDPYRRRRSSRRR